MDWRINESEQYQGTLKSGITKEGFEELKKNVQGLRIVSKCDQVNQVEFFLSSQNKKSMKEILANYLEIYKPVVFNHIMYNELEKYCKIVISPKGSLFDNEGFKNLAKKIQEFLGNNCFFLPNYLQKIPETKESNIILMLIIVTLNWKQIAESSFIKDEKGRLEFIGDSAMNLCVLVSLMFKKELFGKSEGEIDKLKSDCVNVQSIYKKLQPSQIGQYAIFQEDYSTVLAPDQKLLSVEEELRTQAQDNYQKQKEYSDFLQSLVGLFSIYIGIDASLVLLDVLGIIELSSSQVEISQQDCSKKQNNPLVNFNGNIQLYLANEKADNQSVYDFIKKSQQSLVSKQIDFDAAEKFLKMKKQQQVEQHVDIRSFASRSTQAETNDQQSVSLGSSQQSAALSSPAKESTEKSSSKIYEFQDKRWLVQALTHPSFTDSLFDQCKSQLEEKFGNDYKIKCGRFNYQLLEYLGDALINFMISKTFYFDTAKQKELWHKTYFNKSKLHDLKTCFTANNFLGFLLCEKEFHTIYDFEYKYKNTKVLLPEEEIKKRLKAEELKIPILFNHENTNHLKEINAYIKQWQQKCTAIRRRKMGLPPDREEQLHEAAAQQRGITTHQYDSISKASTIKGTNQSVSANSDSNPNYNTHLLSSVASSTGEKMRVEVAGSEKVMMMVGGGVAVEKKKSTGEVGSEGSEDKKKTPGSILSDFNSDLQDEIDLSDLQISFVKVFGDVFEAINGAVFFDSLNLSAVQRNLIDFLMKSRYLEQFPLREHDRTKVLQIYSSKVYSYKVTITHQIEDREQNQTVVKGYLNNLEVLRLKFDKADKNKIARFYRKLGEYLEIAYEMFERTPAGNWTNAVWLQFNKQYRDDIRAQVAKSSKKKEPFVPTITQTIAKKMEKKYKKELAKRGHLKKLTPDEITKLKFDKILKEVRKIQDQHLFENELVRSSQARKVFLQHPEMKSLSHYKDTDLSKIPQKELDKFKQMIQGGKNTIKAMEKFAQDLSRIGFDKKQKLVQELEEIYSYQPADDKPQQSIPQQPSQTPKQTEQSYQLEETKRQKSIEKLREKTEFASEAFQKDVCPIE